MRSSGNGLEVRTIGEIREYWEDDGRRYLVVQYVGLLAMVILLLPYIVALTTMLGRAEAGARLWSRVSLAGGVCFVAVTIAANSIGRRWHSAPTRSATTGCGR